LTGVDHVHEDVPEIADALGTARPYTSVGRVKPSVAAGGDSNVQPAGGVKSCPDEKGSWLQTNATRRSPSATPVGFEQARLPTAESDTAVV
jgi:hypothetical protein